MPSSLKNLRLQCAEWMHRASPTASPIKQMESNWASNNAEVRELAPDDLRLLGRKDLDLAMESIESV